MSISVEDYIRAVAKGVRAGMKRVLVLEPQVGPWVSQNLWGDRRSAPLPSTAGSVVGVLGKNAMFYGPPTVHSIQLGRSDAVDAQNADVYARVTYGCGGANNSFDLDWLHGVQFALVCNTVSVDAVSYAPNGPSAYNAAAASVVLAAFVCKGTVTQGRCPATFTQAAIRLNEIATPGSFATYNVPDFAREFTAHVDKNSNPATPRLVSITFQNQGGTALAQYDAQVCAGGRSIPIPGGANTVIIDNATADKVPLTAQWFLGL